MISAWIARPTLVEHFKPFVVLGMSRINAKENAENFLLKRKCPAWSNVYVVEATPESLLEILGDDIDHNVLTGPVWAEAPAGLVPLWVGITGPGSVDDLINGGREAVARAGYQVGGFGIVQDCSPNGICGHLEVSERLSDLVMQKSVRLTWGEYAVEAERP